MPNTFYKLTIRFKNFYRNDGTGLHFFSDTYDQRKYLYTKCEAFFCNRWFPCIDQPDIKGTFSLKVIAPSPWVVISNEKLE